MKERNNTSRIFDRVWAVIAALVALLLLFCKMSGQLAWSWPGVALGYVGIMCALMFCCVLLANAVILACKLHRWNRTRRVDGQDVNGWFIGYIETADNTYFFATNIGADSDATGGNATEITMSILSDMNIWK